MPGLDVLRGLAILMVLVFHGFEPHEIVFGSLGPHAAPFLISLVGLGHYGVHLFFVLSGFLITGILLDTRNDADFYRNFYLRRALRILPAYCVLLAVLFGMHRITPLYLLVCLLYLCNMPGLLGVNPQYGPLWSLSVEEQFYLTWPFLVRRLSLRHLAIFCALLILLVPVLRFVLLFGPHFAQDIGMKTWAVMDFFAAGGCLAIAIRSSRVRPMLRRAVVPLLAGGGLLFILLSFIPIPAGHIFQKALLAVTVEPWLLGFTGLVLLAYLRPGIAKGFLAKPLVFLANISYGLYLCHQLIFDLVEWHWPFHSIDSLSPLPRFGIVFLAEVAVSIVVAWVSRNTVEAFFLNLKPKHHREPYRTAVPAQVP
jgi:peptidoglycan/LPS O-acetylase OafA/YrhL